MAPQKIGRRIHVLQIVGDPVGGLRRHVHSLLRGLDPEEFILSYAYSRVSVDSAFRHDILELRPRFYAEIPLNVYKKPHFNDIANMLRLYRFMCTARVDVVHGHGAKGGLYARLAGSRSGIGTVYTPHGGTAHDMFSRAEASIYSWVERRLADMTDHYLFESPYTAEAMRSKLGRLGNNWSVNPNGIEPFSSELSSDYHVRLKDAGKRRVARFGVFGILRKQKGQAYAIEAVAGLRREGRDVSLHIFGEGPDRCELLEKVEALGVGDSVFFYGDVSPVEPWMIAMDLVLIPSLFESFGYVAIEAMALERPVIASATGGLVDLLQQHQGALLVPPGNAEVLQKALTRYLEAPADLHDAAKLGARQIGEEYSASKMVGRAAELYRALASNECFR